MGFTPFYRTAKLLLPKARVYVLETSPHPPPPRGGNSGVCSIKGERENAGFYVSVQKPYSPAPLEDVIFPLSRYASNLHFTRPFLALFLRLLHLFYSFNFNFIVFCFLFFSFFSSLFHFFSQLTSANIPPPCVFSNIYRTPWKILKKKRG